MCLTALEVTKHLKQHEGDVLLCLRCGYCREMYRPRTGHYAVCPLREEIGFESTYARGRLVIARTILGHNRLPPLRYSPRLVERIYTCLLCGNCKEVCGPGVDTVAVTKAMRADIFEAGYAIPTGLAKLGEAVEKKHNIYEAPQEERTGWVTPDIKIEKEADILYLPGCMASYRFPEIARSTAKVLNGAGVGFTVLGVEEWCCGNPLFLTGQLPLAREMVTHMVSKLKEREIRKVVTSCAGCYRCLTTEYPAVTGEKETPFEVLHTSQLFAELIDAKELSFVKPIEETVTWHDPCELGRHSKIYDQPRRVIDSIPGIKRVEMLRHGTSAWCCGGGGGVKVSFPDLAAKVASRRLREAVEAGATMIVSGCPSCKWNIRETVEKIKAPLMVVDVSELCAKAMGIRS